MKWYRIAQLVAGAGLLVAAGCVSPDKSVSSPARFVGSEKCSTCHQQAFDTWKASYHARMVLPLREGLLKDAAEHWASDGNNAGPAKGNIDGKAFGMEDVVYVVGTRWKQRYLVKNAATGNHQFMDKQWNRYTKQWEPYGQKNDWETQCATCHTTGFRVLAVDDKTHAVTKHAYTERGVGCEACHGPGSAHAATGDKTKIFNPKNASPAEASKACGYCHVRVENEKFRTAQGNLSEHIPHPVIGESFKAGQDDWTTWYPEHLLAPAVHAEDRITAENKGTDLFNAFWQDEQSRKSGRHDARKHHQQYQEFLQSKHSDVMSCGTCHTPHSVAVKKVEAKAVCQNCHGAQYDADKVMPGTGQTAQQFFVKTHTFNAQQARAGGMTADRLAPAQFFYAK